MRRALSACLLALGLLGCGSSSFDPGGDGGTQSSLPDATQPPERGESLAALESAGDCATLEAELKDSLRRQMRRDLALARVQARAAYSRPCTTPFPYQDAGPSGPPPPPESRASDYTQTNTQVEGIDEPDFVKNDGKYLYVLAGDRLWIIQAWPALTAHVVSSTAVPATGRKLFVHADRALVFSSPGYAGGAGRDCTYGYGCAFLGDRVPAVLSLYDIADREHPRLLRELRLSSAFLAARRIGDVVHTMLVADNSALPRPQTWPPGLSPSPICGRSDDITLAQIEALFDGLGRANEALIDGITWAGMQVHYSDTIYGASGPVTTQGNVGECSQILVSKEGDADARLTLLSLDMTAEAPFAAATVFGRPGAVYASSSSLYVASRHDRVNASSWYYDASVPEATTVHKFTLDGASSAYAASGVLPGRLLNQFAMDERGGFLRIATTSGHLPDPDATNSLTVLVQEGAELRKAGRLDGIARGEDIRAVRFNGDVGYLVTFKKTDPLFVLDLSDPTAPHVEGELQIPGFSTYLHQLDPTHLLTIGFDADDQGDFAWFAGILLQIFDVTDLASPRLLHREAIGTRGTTSEAATNHLAFTYLPSRHLLAVPMTVCEGGSGGSYGNTLTFSGLLVYDVTLDAGFNLVGGLPQVNAATVAPAPWYRECYQWWSEATTAVKRSVIMEDWVYSISDDKVQVASVLDLASPAVTIDLLR